jgi:hypothetical protein
VGGWTPHGVQEMTEKDDGDKDRDRTRGVREEGKK